MQRRSFIYSSAAGLLASTAGARSPNVARNETRSESGSWVETSEGAKLFCRSWGSGRPVVFIHGWAVSGDVWQYQMAPLSAQLRCVTYDKRGHGRSNDPGRGYNYDSLADDLAAVLDQLDLKNVVLVGHSMGPAEIARYLSRHGAARVSRIVLISSALPFMLKAPDNPQGIDPAILEQRRQQWLQDLPKFLASNARSFVTADTSAETVTWIASLGAQASLKALLDLNHAITETDLRADVARITVPTLIVHGGQDKSAPLELTGKRVAAMIPGSQLKIYDDAPHGLLLTHQNRLNPDLLQWASA
jgi:non-heme chloroperoxidase